MGEVPLSLHVDAELMAQLEQKARQMHLATDDLVRQVLGDFVGEERARWGDLEERIAEADKGEFISAGAMLDWMRRLESDPNATSPEVDTVFSPKA
ncbi:MAG: hypothetical protein INR68_00975 [Methylobacterium mesophilicum]|nr:hypothetical protein [Methylobacterium mesophilicum]